MAWLSDSDPQDVNTISSGAHPTHFAARCAVSCTVIALGIALAVYGTYSSVAAMLAATTNHTVS